MGRARRSGFTLVLGLLVLAGLAFATSARPIDAVGAAAVGWPTSTLLVSEVVTGGTSASDEFVELVNAGAAAVDLAGLEIVYATSSGSTVTQKASWTGSRPLLPGQHLLIANAAGSYGTLGDATYTGGLAATGGAVALRVVGGETIDAIGWGDATNAFVEGTAAPAPAARLEPGATARRCRGERHRHERQRARLVRPGGADTAEPRGATHRGGQPVALGAGHAERDRASASPSASPSASGTLGRVPDERTAHANDVAQSLERGHTQSVANHRRHRRDRRCAGDARRRHRSASRVSSRPRPAGSVRRSSSRSSMRPPGIVVRLPTGAAGPATGRRGRGRRQARLALRAARDPAAGRRRRRRRASTPSRSRSRSSPPELGEAVEGDLVSVRVVIDKTAHRETNGGLTLDARDATTGGRLAVKADVSSAIATTDLPRNAHAQLVGIVGQRATHTGSLDGYRIWLRDRADIVVTDPPAGPSPIAERIGEHGAHVPQRVHRPGPSVAGRQGPRSSAPSRRQAGSSTRTGGSWSSRTRAPRSPCACRPASRRRGSGPGCASTAVSAVRTERHASPRRPRRTSARARPSCPRRSTLCRAPPTSGGSSGSRASSRTSTGLGDSWRAEVVIGSLNVLDQRPPERRAARHLARRGPPGDHHRHRPAALSDRHRPSLRGRSPLGGRCAPRCGRRPERSGRSGDGVGLRHDRWRWLRQPGRRRRAAGRPFGTARRRHRDPGRA